MNAWMVRCGRGGRFFDVFRDRSIVAVGWATVGDLSSFRTRDQFVAAVRRGYPDFTDQAALVGGSQLFRFAIEFTEGDRVVTYDPRARRYLCGELIGPYIFDANEENEGLRNQRPVRWGPEIARDAISQASRNSLGSTLTIFKIAPEFAAELWGEAPLVGKATLPRDLEPVAAQMVDADDEGIAALASEAIKDRISELTWQQMQDLVAGLLRAMGYKTLVSPAGSDRGKDIVASPDGFGFQPPRIVVEVKHRLGERMGSGEIRSFLGGRHPEDRGLYVSTGGFSKDAYYEAERVNIPLHLMDFEGLVEAILDHYPSFDEETKQILPLRRFYWPVTRDP
jgi:restriction system protein